MAALREKAAMQDRRSLLMAYLTGLRETPACLKAFAFKPRTLEHQLQESTLRGRLRKAFGRWDLLFLGLGIVVGSGWVQLSTQAAQTYAAASLILSYIFSGLAALCAAACYGELSIEFPVSGGAFTYVMVTFGELPAFITASALIMQYMFALAQEAKAFSSYLAILCGASRNIFYVVFGSGQFLLDIMASGIVMLFSVLLSLGMRKSSLFITALTTLKICLLLTIACVGFSKADTSNMTPFLSQTNGFDGVLQGGAFLFFTFSGFDAIGNAAEEVKNPAHLPSAFVYTVAVAMLLYFLLALSLVLMIPFQVASSSLTGITFPATCQPLPEYLSAFQAPCLCPIVPAGVTDAATCNSYMLLSDVLPFNQVCSALPTLTNSFTCAGYSWMRFVIAAGALVGITTALLVGLYSASRVVMTVSRDWLLPPFLARISPRTQTPVLAQMVMGVLIGILACLAINTRPTAIPSLASFGCLLAMYAVCNVQMYRRYLPGAKVRFTRYGTVEEAATVKASSWVPGSRLSQRMRTILVWVHLAGITGIAVALAAYYEVTVVSGGHNRAEARTSIILVAVWVIITLSFQLCCPLDYNPQQWCIPGWLMPWVPSAAILLIAFSMASLPNHDYILIAAWMGGTLLFYFLFSLPMSYIKRSHLDYDNTEQLNVVELVYKGGSWVEQAHSSAAVAPAAYSVSGRDDSQPTSLYLTGASASMKLSRSPSNVSQAPVLSLVYSQGQQSLATSRLRLQLMQLGRLGSSGGSNSQTGTATGTPVSSTSRMSSHRLSAGLSALSTVPEAPPEATEGTLAEEGQAARPPLSPARPAAGQGSPSTAAAGSDQQAGGKNTPQP